MICAIELGIKMSKAEFKSKDNFHQQIELKLVKKKQEKCYIWSVALYGVGTWTPESS
jgi:hypothetical protein